MKEFFQKIVEPLARPLAWLLSLFYDLTHSYGFAVILLTLTVMVLLTPLTIKATSFLGPRYTLTGLPPGEYFVVAVKDVPDISAMSRMAFVMKDGAIYRRP